MLCTDVSFASTVDDRSARWIRKTLGTQRETDGYLQGDELHLQLENAWLLSRSAPVLTALASSLIFLQEICLFRKCEMSRNSGTVEGEGQMKVWFVLEIMQEKNTHFFFFGVDEREICVYFSWEHFLELCLGSERLTNPKLDVAMKNRNLM